MNMNETISSIDKANVENIKESILNAYKIEKCNIENRISDWTHSINTCKMQIAAAAAKPEIRINVPEAFAQIRDRLTRIRNAKNDLEDLEKAFEIVKID